MPVPSQHPHRRTPAQELAPLAPCRHLTHLTVDLLLARTATAVRHLAMPAAGLAAAAAAPPMTAADEALAALAAHVNGRAAGLVAGGGGGGGGDGGGGAVVHMLPPQHQLQVAAAAAGGGAPLNPFEVDLPVLGQVRGWVVGSGGWCVRG